MGMVSPKATLSPKLPIVCFEVAKREESYTISLSPTSRCDVNIVLKKIFQACDSICHEGRDVGEDDRLEPNVVSKSFRTCDLAFAFLSKRHQTMVGFTTCVFGKDHVYIDVICARKAYKGLGKEMLKQVCDLAREHDKIGILLYSTEWAKNVYRHWNFTDVKAHTPGTIHFGITDPRSISLHDFQTIPKVKSAGWMIHVFKNQLWINDKPIPSWPIWSLFIPKILLFKHVCILYVSFWFLRGFKKRVWWVVKRVTGINRSLCSLHSWCILEIVCF